MRFVLAVAVGMVIAGCGGAAGTGAPAADAVHAYARALREGDARAAYGLLDADTRSRTPFETFEARLRENRGDLGGEAGRVEQAAARGVTERARTRLANGEEVVLVREDGEWRIEGGVVGAPALRTPLDAVAALRQALQRRSMGELQRVLARQARSEVEAEMARVIEATADPLDLHVEIQGNVARVRMSDGTELQLVREAGEWHVAEIH